MPFVKIVFPGKDKFVDNKFVTAIAKRLEAQTFDVVQDIIRAALVEALDLVDKMELYGIEDAGRRIEVYDTASAPGDLPVATVFRFVSPTGRHFYEVEILKGTELSADIYTSDERLFTVVAKGMAHQLDAGK